MLKSAGGISEIYCYDPNPVVINTWYNFTVVLSATDIKIYRNGQLVNTVVNSDTMLAVTGTMRLACGLFAGANNDFLNGNYAVAKIYNRVLTDIEIQQNFNATRGRFGI